MRKGAQILDRFQKILDFVFFPLGLSNFWVGTWFPFDEVQFIGQVEVERSRNVFEINFVFDLVFDSF